MYIYKLILNILNTYNIYGKLRKRLSNNSVIQFPI